MFFRKKKNYFSNLGTYADVGLVSETFVVVDLAEGNLTFALSGRNFVFSYAS